MAVAAARSAPAHPFVLPNAFTSTTCGPFNILLDFEDDAGNRIDATQIRITAELQEKISHMLCASFEAYADGARRNQRQIDENFFRNISIKRDPSTGRCTILDGTMAPVDGNTVSLNAQKIQQIASENPQWQGQTVKDAFDFSYQLFRKPTENPLSQNPNSPTTNPPSNPTIQQHPVHTSLNPTRTNRSSPFTSIPVEEPDSTLLPLPDDELQDPQQGQAAASYARFIQTTFRLHTIARNLTFRDIYSPVPSEKPMIKAHLQSTLQKIRNREPLDENEQTLWTKIQEYFHHRLNGSQNPWSSELVSQNRNLTRIFEEDRRAGLNTYQGVLQSCYQLHLGYSEFSELLRKYQIDDSLYEQNIAAHLPNAMSPVIRDLWNFTPTAHVEEPQEEPVAETTSTEQEPNARLENLLREMENLREPEVSRCRQMSSYGLQGMVCAAIIYGGYKLQSFLSTIAGQALHSGLNAIAGPEVAAYSSWISYLVMGALYTNSIKNRFFSVSAAT